MNSYSLYFFSSFLLIAIGVVAQSNTQLNLQDTYRLEIKRTSEKMAIDGKLEEQVWNIADVGTDFWMSFPIDKIRADEADKTEVRVTYDDNFIYISAICFDKNNFIIPSLKRDNREFWRGDAFAVVIDPVNERQNGFSFGVNPANVQMESLITGQTGRRGQSSRGVNSAWDNKWFSAVSVELDKWVVEMAIPFKTLRFDPNKGIWGINFIRGEPETNSYHTWSPVPVQFRGIDLGFTGAIVWDTPPANTKSNISLIPYVLGSTSKDFEDETPNELDTRAGLDAKVAVTSSLNLDITLNPDFSQVDVDEQVTNLTAFSIRFPERRLFFLENSDLFENYGIPPMRPFFSRRIGLDEDGNTIPILYGARLSGNVNKDLRLGLMNMHTRETEETVAQNYTSLALQQRIFGRTVIKGYFHNRQGMADGEFQGDNYNRIGGLEFSYQSMDGQWRSFGGYGLSYSDNIETDNYFYNIGVGYDNKNWSLYSNLAGVGNNYYTDIGWIPLQDHYDAIRDTSIHIGFQHWFTRIGYTLFSEENPAIISHQFELRNVFDAKNDWDVFRNNLEFRYRLNWRNTSNLTVSYNNTQRELLYPFDFADGDPLPAGTYWYNSLEAEYETDQRKVLWFNLGLNYGGFYNGTIETYTVGARYRVQPWGNFGVNFSVSNLTFPDPFGSERLFLVSPRMEINFSTNIFWTTFLQYNTQRDNFNINSRLQWRFQPMSDLFIVYSDNYAVEFFGPKNRTLVVKLNYWLNL